MTTLNNVRNYVSITQQITPAIESFQESLEVLDKYALDFIKHTNGRMLRFTFLDRFIEVPVLTVIKIPYLTIAAASISLKYDYKLTDSQNVERNKKGKHEISCRIQFEEESQTFGRLKDKLGI